MHKNRLEKSKYWIFTKRYVPVFILFLTIIFVAYIGYDNHSIHNSVTQTPASQEEKMNQFEREIDNANFILAALGITVTVSGFVLTFYGYFQATKFKEIINEVGDNHNRQVEKKFEDYKQEIDKQFKELKEQLKQEFDQKVNSVIAGIQILTGPVIAESKEFRSLEKRLNQAKERCPDIWDRYFLALFNWNKHLKHNQTTLPTRKYAEYAFRYMEGHLKEHAYHKEAWLMLMRWYNREDQDVRAVDTLRRFLERDPANVYLVEREVTNWDIQHEDILEWKEEIIKEAKQKSEDPLRYAYRILNNEDMRQNNEAVKKAVFIIYKYLTDLKKEGKEGLQDQEWLDDFFSDLELDDDDDIFESEK
ncbi:hypothetical protein [Thermoflavimicrobium daqui]|uniref:Uncharacterized protein n=1 Tax=Thermoflavimicrobium daqui TaxID=2137476 RepID=A0A364K3D1_9BACL|nr:hypothetical protein [Thermoflavimicrobium daqui]RAL23342.1 hypothetical protein DL897_11665 [Thermoflavimicrobium daqui]